MSLTSEVFLYRRKFTCLLPESDSPFILPPDPIGSEMDARGQGITTPIPLVSRLVAPKISCLI